MLPKVFIGVVLPILVGDILETTKAEDIITHQKVCSNLWKNKAITIHFNDHLFSNGTFGLGIHFSGLLLFPLYNIAIFHKTIKPPCPPY